MFKRLSLLAILLVMLCTFATSCHMQPSQPLSETVLLSITYPGDGFGTRAMCASAEVYVHKNGSIHIFMPDTTFEKTIEIGSLQMSPEDYAELEAFANVDTIPWLWAFENEDVCDGTSYFITLYADGEPDPIPVLRKGGYMPNGILFKKRYRGIRERLDAYGVRDAVEAWRYLLESGEV